MVKMSNSFIMQMQKKIINALHVRPRINPKYEIARRVNLLKSYLVKTGLRTLVLGISGGIDSTLAGRISQLAVDELNHDFHTNVYKFIAIRLPYGEQADESDAMEAIKFIQPSATMRVNIKPATDALAKTIQSNKNGKVSDFNRGNMKARERMIVQYSVAETNHGLVVGTDHAAEGIVKFFTKYGDGASDICPLQGLDKEQVRACAKELHAPKNLVLKKATADLESKHVDRPDYVELGTTYKNVDNFLEGKDMTTNSKDKSVAELLIHKYIKSLHKGHMPVNLWSTFWK